MDLARAPRAVAHEGTPDTGNSALGLAVDMGALEFQPPRVFARKRTLP
jgi:hypothetical protein